MSGPWRYERNAQVSDVFRGSTPDILEEFFAGLRNLRNSEALIAVEICKSLIYTATRCETSPVLRDENRSEARLLKC